MGEQIERTFSVEARERTEHTHGGYIVRGRGIELLVSSREQLHKQICSYLIPYTHGVFKNIEITIKATKADYDEGNED